MESQLSLAQILATKILPALNLKAEGELWYPKEGRIAHNGIILTNFGEVLFRCYPKYSSKEALGYGIERARFEVKVLNFFASKGLAVPVPLEFPDGNISIEIDNWFIFAYYTKPGKTLEKEDLSLNVAQKAGNLLNKIISVSQTYLPTGDEPDGDIDYIKKIINNFLNRRPDFANNAIFSDMSAYMFDNNLLPSLLVTPKGIVHGDYFFENVLFLNNDIVGVIDFGDAYYGYLIMDIAIGSMEFSTHEDEELDLHLFGAFIKQNREWLLRNEISFDLFKYILVINCIRFTAHIFNLAQDSLDSEGLNEVEIDISENPYINRFYKFQETDLSKKMMQAYNLALAT